MQEEFLLWPDEVTCGEIVYAPGGSFGPRIQPMLQLVLIYRGSMTVWIDGEPRAATANTASVLLPGHEERFAFAPDEETHHSWAHLHVPELPCALRERLAALPWPLPLSAATQGLMHSLLALRNVQLPTAPQVRKAIATQMIWQYIGEGEQHAAGHRQALPSAIEHACAFIATHLEEHLVLDDIAHAASVSPAHLVRLFRAHLALTPIAYLWRQRIAQGITLLEQTGLNVGVIATRCGFQNSYHFSRRVKAATGLSPLAVRRRAWRR